MNNLKLVYDYNGEWVTLLLNDVKILEGHSLRADHVLKKLAEFNIINSLTISEIDEIERYAHGAGTLQDAKNAMEKQVQALLSNILVEINQL